MTQCNAIGALTVGGREVAAFQCCLEAGHHSRFRGRTPHEHIITWTDHDIDIPDAALFDPDERFDVDVPFSA